MNIKQKILFPVLFLILSFSTAIFYDVSTTYAWCDNLNASTKDQCVYDNYDNLDDKRGVDQAKYLEWVNSCFGTNTGGGIITDKADGGECANAVTNCMRYAVNLDKCGDSELTAKWASKGCNGGRGTSESPSCAAGANKNEFTDKDKAVIDKAVQNCTQNQGQQQKNLEDCKKSVEQSVKSCKEKQGMTSAGGYDDRKNLDINAYQKCINDGMLTTSKDKAECEGRGGVWNSTNGPIVGSRCSAPKSADPKTTCDDGSTPGADGKCADGSTPGKKTAEQPSGSYKGTQTQNCGKAQTNILSCDKDSSGSEVIGYILKAILMIMSVGVGILAVGGIVYGAILYSSAQDNAAQTKKAIEVIINTVIGLLLYIFMYSILNWLVPGGVFL